jgi:acyl-CoA synthetase (AMP-forming)/AMP-acid ligase II
VEFNLADLFETVADVAGARTAVVAGHRRLSYVELDERANRLAHRLAAGGIGVGDFVGLQLVNGTEYLEAMLACFKIRAVPVNINYRYVAEELRYLFRDAGIVGLVFHGRFGAAVAESVGQMTERRVVLEVADGTPSSGLGGDYEQTIGAERPDRDFGPRSADDLYCVYTGGTTGMPKGVLWRHEDIFFAGMGGGDPLSLGNVVSAPEELSGRVVAPGLVALAASPFMHASAHWLAFTMLFGGGTVVVLPGGRFDAGTLWGLVEKEKVNIVVVVGDAMALPLLDWLEGHPESCHTSLLAVGSGGAALSAPAKRRLARALPNCMVVDAFGSSETGQLGGHAPPDDPFGAPALRVDGLTAVLDEGGKPVVPGSGVVGRLARSGHIPLRYMGDPDKTAAVFVKSGGTRWALPGDLATVAADGTITLLGRGSLCINTGGEKVFPDEVERAVRECRGVRDVVVVGAPDPRFGEQVAALVEALPGAVVDAGALRATCRERLAGYKVPRLVVEVDSIHRSPAGKADYVWAAAVAARAATAGVSGEGPAG